MILTSTSTTLVEEESPYSPQLLEANRRLLTLRQQVQAARSTPSDKSFPNEEYCLIPTAVGGVDDEAAVEYPPVLSAIHIKANGDGSHNFFDNLPTPKTTACSVSSPANVVTAVAVGPVFTAVEAFANLPSHLGWGSERLTAVYRANGRLAGIGHAVNNSPTRQANALTAVPSLIQEPVTLPLPSPLTLHPSSFSLCWGLAYAILREEMAPVARIWLLLRHLDEAGRGWVSIETARQALTEEESPLKVCGWRQLRNLLAEGHDVFWERDKTHIWLRSMARVAFALGVEQMGRAVSLPVAVLNGRLADFKAHLYVSFHTCRQREDKVNKPIARATMADLSGVKPSSQRSYEVLTGTHKTSHFAVGIRQSDPEMCEEAAWQKGTAVFPFHDAKGRQGPKQKNYLAWQLPNSYQSQQTSKGKQKRHNRKLIILRHQRGLGKCQSKIGRRYFEDGAKAGKAYCRNFEQDVYWPSRTSDNVWHVIMAQARK